MIDWLADIIGYTMGSSSYNQDSYIIQFSCVIVAIMITIVSTGFTATFCSFFKRRKK